MRNQNTAKEEIVLRGSKGVLILFTSKENNITGSFYLCHLLCMLKMIMNLLLYYNLDYIYTGMLYTNGITTIMCPGMLLVNPFLMSFCISVCAYVLCIYMWISNMYRCLLEYMESLYHYIPFLLMQKTTMVVNVEFYTFVY